MLTKNNNQVPKVEKLEKYDDNKEIRKLIILCVLAAIV